MSNRRTRLNSLVNSIRSRRALGLMPEVVPYASVEVIHADNTSDIVFDNRSEEALATAVVSRRAFAVRCAQEMADFTGESFAVWENTEGNLRTLKADEWPDGAVWGRVATVNPQ